MFLPGIGLWLLFSIALCVHVVRTNQAMYWLMIILMMVVIIFQVRSLSAMAMVNCTE